MGGGGAAIPGGADDTRVTIQLSQPAGELPVTGQEAGIFHHFSDLADTLRIAWDYGQFGALQIRLGINPNEKTSEGLCIMLLPSQ
jgi:hypothetical protein